MQNYTTCRDRARFITLETLADMCSPCEEGTPEDCFDRRPVTDENGTIGDNI